MRRAVMLAWVAGTAGCGSAPQKQDETAVTYLAVFTAEQGINATVVFPSPSDNGAVAVQQGMSVDGGTFSSYNDLDGTGFAIQGMTSVFASYSNAHLTGLGSGSALPMASLTRGVPDGGPNEFYFFVNKNGLQTINVQFEYTAQRDCGGGCGGKKSWTYTGSVGAAEQAVTLTYVEEKTP